MWVSIAIELSIPQKQTFYVLSLPCTQNVDSSLKINLSAKSSYSIICWNPSKIWKEQSHPDPEYSYVILIAVDSVSSAAFFIKYTKHFSPGSVIRHLLDRLTSLGFAQTHLQPFLPKTWTTTSLSITQTTTFLKYLKTHLNYFVHWWLQSIFRMKFSFNSFNRLLFINSNIQ